MPPVVKARNLALKLLSSMGGSPYLPTPPVGFLILEHAAALGTVLHATPLIAALRRAAPRSMIVVAASGFGLEVLRSNPNVDDVIHVANPKHRWIAARKDLARVSCALKRNCDSDWVTITPSGNERTTIALAAYFAGAINRVGFTLAHELYTQALAFDPNRSQIANNLRIVETLGLGVPGNVEPEMFFQPSDSSYAISLLGGDFDPTRPLIAFITQTYKAQRKSWHSERFVAVANAMIERHRAQIVFVGTEAEREAIESIRTSIASPTWNLAGQTDLQQLAALLSLCDVGLTLDTGTLHLGRSVGLPMAIIAPAWSPVVEWLPVGNPRYRILKNLDISAAPANYIIDEISVDDAVEALNDLLRRFPRPIR